jgi:hypothetical protein
MFACTLPGRVFARLLTVFVACSFNAAVQAAAPIEFNRDVRPILADKCFACHGFDAKHRQADLRLDLADSAYAEREGSRAIVPRDLAASSLWKRITTADEGEVMPPPETNKKLTDAEKQILRRWIEEGAKYQMHWAFEPIREQSAPKVTGKGITVRNPIDAFIAQRLQREGLTMSPEADRSTLIRRVAFALTGLPPTIAEVDAFLADKSPDAYEKMVDRYLASKHYGEEMARHWLDVARYADTHGLHLDNERQMWAYRDWVVGAFNRNLPFDQFTVEQLAGDLLPTPTTEQLVATGFNRCNVTTSEGGSIAAEFTFRYAVDRASTTAETWLGLTAGCAVCHDHKFDPLSQKEFYSLYAFFNSAADPAMDGNALLTQPVMRLETPDMGQKLKALDKQIAAVQEEIDEEAARVQYTDPASLSPPPPATETETVWLDDSFPTGAQVKSSGHPTTFVAREKGEVFSGKLSLRRSSPGLSQDYYEGGASPLVIPPQAKLVAHVYLDVVEAPKAIMLQFHKGGWQHRAVWGDYTAIDWGKANTTERYNAGPLPALGEWVRIEVPAEKLGLSAGDAITGFACTQFGGTMFWDKVGVVGRSDPASDPQHSFQAWWKQAKGKDTPGIAPDLAEVAKRGPDEKIKPEVEKRLLTFYLQSFCSDTKPQFAALADQMGKLRREREALDKTIPSTFIYKDLDQPRESFVMKRGQYDQPGEKVEPAVPAILPALKRADANKRATRLDLARWLVAPENPLTARVTVNRFWQQFFGTGLVKTSFDFGSQGEPPSHPELLDYLAIEFQRGGWDMKQLVKQLLTSATFRQSSRVTPALVTRDPENRLYARGPRFRLDAEQIRDNALFVSGLANLDIGGKGVKPYQPVNIWEPVGFVGSNTRMYQQDNGSALYRRSIYTFLKRTAPPPFMANFDAPNREQFCTKRERSNTPLQALQLMNDVQHVEAARAFAERILTEGGKTPAERITFAYRTVLSRLPEADELKIIENELSAHRARYEKDVEAAKKLIAHGESKPKADLAPAEVAAYTLVANMILNLDETLTRN